MLKTPCVSYLTSAAFFFFLNVTSHHFFPSPPQVTFQNCYKWLFVITKEESPNLHTHLSSYFHIWTKVCINLLTLGSMFLCCCEKTDLFNMKARPGFLPQQWHCPWIKIVLLFSISWTKGSILFIQDGGRGVRTSADHFKHLCSRHSWSFQLPLFWESSDVLHREENSPE